jgi:hypothetical protein
MFYCFTTGPKATGPSFPMGETSETVSQNKYFLLASYSSQAFCNSHAKLTKNPIWKCFVYYQSGPIT